MMIRDWPVSTRPREKLIQEGAYCLSDAELLAIVLRTGIKGKNAVNLAQELLNKFGSLRRLLRCDLHELTPIKGLGNAKFAQIIAIQEIAQRSLQEELSTKPSVKCSKDASQFLMTKMRDNQHEVFACLLLNSRHQLIRYKEISVGSINSAGIYPREVVKLVLKFNAAAIIFAHNHPSGNNLPSDADKEITKRLKLALELIDVPVLDHIIVGEEPFSMSEHKLI